MPDCNIKNFTSDWNNGINLSALLEYCRYVLMLKNFNLKLLVIIFLYIFKFNSKYFITLSNKECLNSVFYHWRFIICFFLGLGYYLIGKGCLPAMDWKTADVLCKLLRGILIVYNYYKI